MTTMTKERALTKAEQAEYMALENKKLDTYVGFNLIRNFFSGKADAERYLVLKMKAGLAGPYLFYGSEVDPHVEPLTGDRWGATHG